MKIRLLYPPAGPAGTLEVPTEALDAARQLTIPGGRRPENSLHFDGHGPLWFLRGTETGQPVIGLRHYHGENLTLMVLLPAEELHAAELEDDAQVVVDVPDEDRLSAVQHLDVRMHNARVHDAPYTERTHPEVMLTAGLKGTLFAAPVRLRPAPRLGKDEPLIIDLPAWSARRVPQFINRGPDTWLLRELSLSRLTPLTSAVYLRVPTLRVSKVLKAASAYANPLPAHLSTRDVQRLRSLVTYRLEQNPEATFQVKPAPSAWDDRFRSLTVVTVTAAGEIRSSETYGRTGGFGDPEPTALLQHAEKMLEERRQHAEQVIAAHMPPS